MSALATLVLLGFLFPAVAVFVYAYRHALDTWLVRPGADLPQAAVASHHAVFTRRETARRLHAVAIATAFSSVFVMAMVALAMVVTALIAP